MKMQGLRSGFFILLCWLFFTETLVLVDWVTGCALTGWLSNEMGTVYVC